jgi:hypothetical protein
MEQGCRGSVVCASELSGACKAERFPRSATLLIHTRSSPSFHADVGIWRQMLSLKKSVQYSGALTQNEVVSSHEPG